MSAATLKTSQEWASQSQYDIDTALSLLKSKRRIYCVFMCHLALEKMLKAVFAKKKSAYPPHTHDLLFLAEQGEITFADEAQGYFVEELNGLNIPTRYPDQLQKMLKRFTPKKTDEIYRSTKKVLSWLKKNYLN
ncbi:MAG TPA: HEPN domain-containing protein [bacterium]|nr:HEPN domain-containing protein [bacterium]